MKSMDPRMNPSRGRTKQCDVAKQQGRLRYSFKKYQKLKEGMNNTSNKHVNLINKYTQYYK